MSCAKPTSIPIEKMMTTTSFNLIDDYLTQILAPTI